VIQVAHLYGWHIAHFRPARTADGSWRTPLQADGAGFPDLVLVRPPRVIFAELKTEDGKLDPLQQLWIDKLRRTLVEVFVWRPHQLDVEIQAALAQ
jgi:VRR-NUC domain